MRGATLRALVTSAPVSTSTVQRIPTVSDLRMVDQATLVISNKLIAALRRNPGLELAIQSSMLDNTEIYSNLLTTLVGSEDSHFSRAILSVQEQQRVITESFDNLNSYYRRAMVNSGNTGRVIPEYLTASFVKDVLTTLCCSYEGFSWNEPTQALTIHTENITLRATIHGTQYVVPMGRFKIAWNLRNFDGNNGSPSQFTISSLDNMHAENAENIIHPHVMNNAMCPGNTTTGVQASLPAALNGGRIVDAFDQIDCLLHNYGPSPYLRLELWGNHLCPGCNLSVARTEMVHCFQCDASHCRGCSKECTDCGRWYCKERCGTYNRVARTYSCPCALNTVRCMGLEDPATGCHLRFNPSTPAGVIEPQTGYCQRCLFLWINGTVPRPAVVHQATVPEPVAPPVRTRRRRSGTLLGAGTILPLPEEFVPVFPEQAAPLSVADAVETIATIASPVESRHSRRTDFPGTFDDLLNAQVAQSTQIPEGLLRERLVIINESAAASLTEPLVTNTQESNSDTGLFASDRLLSYQAMFEDMTEGTSVAPEPGVPSLEVVSAVTAEQENVEVQIPVLTEDQIRRALEDDDEVEELIRLSAGSRSMLRTHLEQTAIAARDLASASEDDRVIGNANRYLDPVLDRWITR